jgi:aminoglycoside 6-adenylyltransferase
MAEKTDTGGPYDIIVGKFREWVKKREDIRAALILGSRARADHPADEWADLDLMAITTNPEFYLSTADWINALGKPLLTFVESTSTGDEKERRVLYEGMLDVDFAILPKRKADMFLRAAENHENIRELSNVLGRGMRVLLDKDQTLAKLQSILRPTEEPTLRKPTEHEFLEVVSDFLYHAVFTAKHLRRGELWWTVMCLDGCMQFLLREMIEWHALATQDWKCDVWFGGRFLEEWAHPRALEELQGTFAHFDEKDIRRSLLASLDLFRWLATETAVKLGYEYPSEVDEHVTKWIEMCL